MELFSLLLLSPLLLGISLEKPDWLKDSLESNWLNFHKGDWLDFGRFELPPFSFEPGKWVEVAIDWLLIPLQAVLNLAEDAWSLAGDAWDVITNYFWTVWGFVAGAVTWWWDIWADAWSWAFETVRDWVGYYYGFLLEWVPQLWEWFTGATAWWWNLLSEWLPTLWAEVGGFVWDTLGDIPGHVVTLWNWLLVADQWFHDHFLNYIAPFSMSLQELIDFIKTFELSISSFFLAPFEWLWTVLVEPLLGDFLDGFLKGLDEEDTE